ncbi:hypothetical protein [Falsibacillus pallidus]|uniref:Lipoprotein n=1 Tax=Falsibacillus pallidus TaxID=493781 RepID=A0A370GT97_9BACI|nr:hypothetical protein [Falsibacillus pallidus]RDI45744.1 hypothetical protein DFR59_102377 [Falsibacillus pallidus]
MKWFLKLSVLFLALSLAACSSQDSAPVEKKTDVQEHAKNGSASEKSSFDQKDAEGNSQKEEQKDTNGEEAQSSSEDYFNTVKLDHISLQVPKEWSIQKGLDSAGFQVNGEAIGGIDGLGYSDDVQSLLPNHHEVLSTEDVKGAPVKTVIVKLTTDALNGEKQTETHVFFIRPDQKAAYDLHFISSKINNETLQSIIKSIQ